MLTPRQLETLPKVLIDIYSEVEADIIADMAARISKMDFIPAAGWQYKKLIEMGQVHDTILLKLSAATKKSIPELEQLMRDAGFESLRKDATIYGRAGLRVPVLESSPELQAILRAGIDSTKGTFENITATTARSAANLFEHVLDRTWLNINSGAFDTNSAVKLAIKDLAAKGLPTIKYPSGHTDYLDVAVRRATVTGVNQTALKMQEGLADAVGCDLVEVTAHAGARTGEGVANHAAWQGKIYSRSGGHPKYPSLVEATGYGTGDGLGGWNCRHSFFPFIEGASEPTYTAAELEDFNAKKYTYNGVKMTEYEATQKQRSIERNIRRWKRELMGMNVAGQPTAEAASKLAWWQNEQKSFLRQTGLKRQYAREEVVGFGKSEAAKARGESLKRPLPKTIKAPDTVLQQTLGDPRIKGIIPKDTVIEKVRVIAGAGTSTVFKNAQELTKGYGGEPLQWQKKGGIIYGKYYRYDIHWDELNGEQYNIKLKGVKGL